MAYTFLSGITETRDRGLSCHISHIDLRRGSGTIDSFGTLQFLRVRVGGLSFKAKERGTARRCGAGSETGVVSSASEDGRGEAATVPR